MSTVLEYDIVSAESVDLLTRHVQGKVAQGWQPLGAPFYLDGSLCQAIVWTEAAAQRTAAAETRSNRIDLELIEELTEDDEAVPRLIDHLERTHSGGSRR
jgi:hypothetical protein